jgi:hypoxanthine phosphoribosyltransferase
VSHPHPAPNDYRIGATLYDENAIRQRVRELASEVSSLYAGLEVTLVSILKGSFIFLADLTRALAIPARVDFLGVSSYRGAESSERIEWTTRLTSPVAGRHVLVVEDIVDTGRTLSVILDYLRDEAPASLRLCAFLDKPSRRVTPVDVDLVGFAIPDCFVVGYGLDYDGWYRHLPYIAVLERDAEPVGK